MLHIQKSVYNYLPFKRILHLIVIISANILFFGSRFYCNYKSFGIWSPADEEVSGKDTTYWWTLRCNLYAITFLVTIVSSYLPKHRYSYFWMAFIIGLSMSDILDRTYFNINKFTTADKGMLIINFILSYVMSMKTKKVAS